MAGGTPTPQLDGGQRQRYIGRRKIAGAHEEHIDRTRGSAPFVDGPDDQGLAPAAVAAGKNLRQSGAKFTVLSFVVRARIAFDAERLADVLLGTFKAHCEEYELSGPELVGFRNLLELPLAVDLIPFDLHRANAGHIAVVIAHEFFAHDAVGAGIVAKFGRDFLMT